MLFFWRTQRVCSIRQQESGTWGALGRCMGAVAEAGLAMRGAVGAALHSGGGSWSVCPSRAHGARGNRLPSVKPRVQKVHTAVFDPSLSTYLRFTLSQTEAAVDGLLCMHVSGPLLRLVQRGGCRALRRDKT